MKRVNVIWRDGGNKVLMAVGQLGGKSGWIGHVLQLGAARGEVGSGPARWSELPQR